MKVQTTMSLEQITWKYLFELGQKNFLYTDTNTNYEENERYIEYIKTECLANNTIKNSEHQVIQWAEIFTTHIILKDSYLEFKKDSYKSIKT